MHSSAAGTQVVAARAQRVTGRCQPLSSAAACLHLPQGAPVALQPPAHIACRALPSRSSGLPDRRLLMVCSIVAISCDGHSRFTPSRYSFPDSSRGTPLTPLQTIGMRSTAPVVPGAPRRSWPGAPAAAEPPGRAGPRRLAAASVASLTHKSMASGANNRGLRCPMNRHLQAIIASLMGACMLPAPAATAL